MRNFENLGYLQNKFTSQWYCFSEIIKKSGAWHRIAQSGRRPDNLLDAASSLFDRMKAELGSRINLSDAASSAESREKTADDQSLESKKWVDCHEATRNDDVNPERLPYIEPTGKYFKNRISTQLTFATGGDEERKI